MKNPPRPAKGNVQPIQWTIGADQNKAARDILNRAMRETLAAIAKGFTEPDESHLVEPMAEWAEAANLESLAEWLAGGGWDNVDAPKCVERMAHLPALRVWGDDPDMEGVDLDPVLDDEARQAILNAVLDDEEAKGLPLAGEASGMSLLRACFSMHYWTPLLDDAGRYEWMRSLAGAWAESHTDRLGEKAAAFAAAVPIMVRPIARTGADEWTAFPRGMESAAALAGPIAIQNPIDYNGEVYGHEPEIAAPLTGRAFKKGGHKTTASNKAPEDGEDVRLLVDWKSMGNRLAIASRGGDIVPQTWVSRPRQMALSLNMEHASPHVMEYIIETATKTAVLADLPNMSLKMLGFLFASAPWSGRACKGTLLDLAKEQYPDLAKRRHPKDLETVAAAFVACGKGLQWMDEKPDGVKHPYDIWTIDYDLSGKPDAAVGYMVNPWLAARLSGKGGGFFILNMSRWKALPIIKPRLFPLVLRLAAYHDQARVNGRYDPNRLQWIEADRLAWECNTMSNDALLYRMGRTDAKSAKAQLARARGNMSDDLEEVKRAGYLGAFKTRKVHGKGMEILPVPYEDYPEACARAVASVQANRRRRGGRA